jgi:hypothetical protein
MSSRKLSTDRKIVSKNEFSAANLFGRPPDYDSNNDPVVRVTAGEVRKRIAQYYDDSVHRNEFRIDLPIGTYVAHFHPGPFTDEDHRVAPQSPVLQADQTDPVACPPTPALQAVARVRPPGKNLMAAIVVLAVLASAVLVWKLGH